MKNLKKNKGFTLIEILVVIAIIAILAAIVIVAINPKKHFDDAKAAQRDANINTILNAVGQYIVDNKGNLPDFMDEVGDDFVDDAMEVNEELCEALVPKYVGAIPSDPDSDSDGAAFSDCDEVDAGDIAYEVEVLTELIDADDDGDEDDEVLTGHVKVCTTLAPVDQICVTR